MKKLTCEEFERDYHSLSTGKIDDDQKTALLNHRESCEHCRAFSPELADLRQNLRELPQLQVPEYFASDLKRKINQFEHGSAPAGKRTSGLPRFAAIATGFAVALLVSFIVFQPGNEPGLTPRADAPGTLAVSEKSEPAAVMEEPPVFLDATETLLTEQSDVLDTATHRLPEPAGTDSIPIPAQDDYWRLNQVSTTPEEN